MAKTAEDLISEPASEVHTVVTLTDEAFKVVADAIAQEPDPGSLALWLEVRGVEANAFAYDLYFQSLSDALDQDSVQYQDALPVVVPSGSIDNLRGARLEWNSEGEGGLVLVNPNSPPKASLAPSLPDDLLALGIDGPLGLRVVAVLEQSVNPSIASHGGRADLVAMDEEKAIAYLALSGGCQGCAASRMTLTQGIEVMLRDEVPELTNIIDVTDHSAGQNPYL